MLRVTTNRIDDRCSFKKYGLITLAAVFVAALLSGLTLGQRLTPTVQAAVCTPALGACGGGTRTSALIVRHVYDPQSTNQAVEPNTGESWSVVVYWNEAGTGDCRERTETATFDVDWNGTTNQWALSNQSLTTNIVGVALCSASLDCSSVSDAHSYGYKLIVDITDPSTDGVYNYNLRQVVYTTTAVDDGSLLNLSSCTLGASQTVNGQTWSATDAGTVGTGGFECAYDCNATGPLLTIEY